LGVTAELLLDRSLRLGEKPGLAFTIVALVGAAMVLAGPFLGVRGPSHSGRLAAALLAFFGLMVSVRASPIMVTINVLVCVGAMLLVANSYAGPSLVRLSIDGYAQAALGGIGSAIGGAGHVLANDLNPSTSNLRRLLPVFRGLLFAAIPLMIFTALFSSADAVFEDYVIRITQLDLGSVGSRLLWAVMIAWAVLGLMRRALRGPKEYPPIAGIPRMGVADAVTALVLVDLLFAVFVVVQFAYFFGGADTMAASGFTYSDYARRGFFELVAVAVLVVCLVLSVDWLVKREPGARARVDRLHAILLALTGVVLVSALQRMRLYTAAFGMTELRLYTTIFMLWVATVLGWMAWTVLRNQRDRFPFGAIMAGLVLLAATNLINPDAFIARANVDHFLATERNLDTVYLTQHLSFDAVPTLVASLPEMDICTAARLAAGLVDRPQEAGGWQGLNWGELRARSAVEGSELGVLASSC
jgi:hypothetical protein